jgi:hypothetical protein
MTALFGFVIVACGSQASVVPGSPSPRPESSVAPTPLPSAAPTGPLLTVETLGGECMAGACGGTIVVESDGRVHATAPKAVELGILPAATLEGLATEISQADFVALKSRPFTDTCPIAFDGQETIYTFATASALERIDSCEVVVDPADPLFVAVSAVLSGVTVP